MGEEFWEVLGHEPEEIDLERLLDEAVPMLWNHDVNSPLGLVKNYEIVDSKGLATALWGTDDFAQQKKLNVDDGTLRKASIRYRIKEMKKVGERDRKPIMRATKWELIEVSLTPLPVDSKVGIGIERSDDAEYLVRSSDSGQDIKVPLEIYEVAVLDVAQPFNLRYYLPEGELAPSRCVMAFEAAALKALQLNDVGQAKVLIEENLVSLSNMLRSYYNIDYTQQPMSTQPVKPENPSSVSVEVVETLRAELQTEAEARKLLQTSYDQLKAQADLQNVKMQYTNLRSAFERLKDVDYKITPVQFDMEFGTLEDDYKKIEERTITSETLASLKFLYDRYSRLESRTLGEVPYSPPISNPEKKEEEKKVYEQRAVSSAKDFSRSLEKSCQVF